MLRWIRTPLRFSTFEDSRLRGDTQYTSIMTCHHCFPKHPLAGYELQAWYRWDRPSTGDRAGTMQEIGWLAGDKDLKRGILVTSTPNQGQKSYSYSWSRGERPYVRDHNDVATGCILPPQSPFTGHTTTSLVLFPIPLREIFTGLRRLQSMMDEVKSRGATACKRYTI